MTVFKKMDVKKRRALIGAVIVIAVIACAVDLWLSVSRKDSKYEQAAALMADGRYGQAYMILSTLDDYRGADTLLEENEGLIRAGARIKAFQTVGGTVTYGSWEQDNDTANGKQDIAWQVLEVDGSHVLLISSEVLDAHTYNDAAIGITWDVCDLRAWLNGDFLETAFTEAERQGILTTEVDNSAAQHYSEWITGGCPTTEDKIFVLSYAEANKYLGVTFYSSSNTAARAKATAYAVARGVNVSDTNQTEDGSASSWWWLRSPGRYQDYGAGVSGNGALYYYENSKQSGGVRPAMWLDLNEADL